MENKSYSEEAIERYKPYQDYILNQMERINVFQNLYGFNKFTDITIRCFNAEMDCIRYFKKHNYDYETEPNCLIIYAYQYYVLDKLNEAIYELNRYIEELQMLFLGKENTLKNRLNEWLHNKNNTKEIFSVSQSHVTKYLRIAEEISNIDIEKDISRIIKSYVNHKHEEVMSLEGYPDQIKEAMYESIITIASSDLREALKNTNLYQGIYSLDEEIEKSLSTKEETTKVKRKRK